MSNLPALPNAVSKKKSNKSKRRKGEKKREENHMGYMLDTTNVLNIVLGMISI